MDTGQLWKCHLDHLRVRGDRPVSGEDTQTQDSEWKFAESPKPPPPLETSQGPNAPTTSSSARPINRCYPQRQHQAPNRYMWDYVYFLIFFIVCYVFVYLLSFCRGGVWCMQDYVSVMSLLLYFVLRMSSRALVFLVYNKWSHECFCDLPQSGSISPKTLQLWSDNGD